MEAVLGYTKLAVEIFQTLLAVSLHLLTLGLYRRQMSPQLLERRASLAVTTSGL
ncbi:MAG: hypothetical protein JO262_19180 [Solirubrobacterales bacterium]|nr:hypothetical protein [Solirubrobacterales bacterium]MBV9944260.1 hypothetical protein [Solirubrobacterales bacterium]